MADRIPLRTLRLPGWSTPVLIAAFCCGALGAIYTDTPGQFAFSCRPFGGWATIYAGIAVVFAVHLIVRHIRRASWADAFAVLLIMPVVLTLIVARHYQCGEAQGYSAALNRDVVLFTLDQTLRSLPVGWDMLFPGLSTIRAEDMPYTIWIWVYAYRWLIFGLAGLSVFRLGMMAVKRYRGRSASGTPRA